MVMQSLLLIPLNQRLSLRVINDQTLLNRLLVIIGTTTLLSALDKTSHQLILRNVQLYHRSHLVATLLQHFLQSLSLRDGAGETVEDNTLVSTPERVIDTGKDTDHQLVGNQLTVVDESLSRLTQLGTFLNLITQHITSGDMP